VALRAIGGSGRRSTAHRPAARPVEPGADRPRSAAVERSGPGAGSTAPPARPPTAPAPSEQDGATADRPPRPPAPVGSTAPDRRDRRGPTAPTAGTDDATGRSRAARWRKNNATTSS